jgi:hypothetical protein
VFCSVSMYTILKHRPNKCLMQGIPGKVDSYITDHGLLSRLCELKLGRHFQNLAPKDCTRHQLASVRKLGSLSIYLRSMIAKPSAIENLWHKIFYYHLIPS